MKKNTFLLAVLMVFLWTGVEQADAAKRISQVKVGKGGARVSLVEGTVTVLSQGKKDWRTVRVREVLQEGDEVRTGKSSRLEIALSDDSTVRFAEKTSFKIVQLTFTENRPKDFRVHVALGRTWANVNKAIGKRKGGFELSCDNAVAGVRGTVYRMNVNEDKSALVRVYDGEVFVKGGGEKITEAPKVMGAPQKVAGPTKVEGPRKVSMEEWTVIIKSMQQVAIKGDGTAEPPRDFTEAEDRDPWVDWNRERDQSKTP